MASYESYKTRIVRTMTKAGTYTPLLTLQIEALASALYVMYRCLEKIQDKDFDPVMMKITRDGKQPVENPVLKTHSRYLAEVSRQMRLLKLTVEDVVGSPDIPDEVDRIEEEMQKIK